MKTLFRENAVKYKQKRDENNTAIHVIGPGDGLGAVCLLLFLFGLILWGIFGKVEIKVNARGILISDEQFNKIEKNRSDNIKYHQDKVETLNKLLTKKTALFYRHYLTIEELEKSKEEVMAAKEALVYSYTENTVLNVIFNENSKSADKKMDALVFVPYSKGKKITPGLATYLLPDGLSVYVHGYVKGKVENISLFPVSKELVYSYLGNRSLVDEFFMDGAPFMVKISLQEDKKMRSGLSWTMSRSSDSKVEPGSMVMASMVYLACSPIQLIHAFLFA